MYKLIISPVALKILRRIPKHMADLIWQKLNILAKDPVAPNPNVKKLKGQVGYRLRVEDWRVIYTLHHNKLEILVIKISPRGGAYQK